MSTAIDGKGQVSSVSVIKAITMLDKLVEKNRLTLEKNKKSVCGVGGPGGLGNEDSQENI